MVLALLVAACSVSTPKLWLVGFEGGLSAWPERRQAGLTDVWEALLTPEAGFAKGSIWGSVSLLSKTSARPLPPKFLKTDEWVFTFTWGTKTPGSCDGIDGRSRWGSFRIRPTSASFEFRSGGTWRTTYRTKGPKFNESYKGGLVPGVAVIGPVLVLWSGGVYQRETCSLVDLRTGKTRKVHNIDGLVLTGTGVVCFLRSPETRDHKLMLPARTEVIDARGRKVLTFKGCWQPGEVDLKAKSLWGRLVTNNQGDGVMAWTDGKTVMRSDSLPSNGESFVVSRRWDLFFRQ